jgi:hypothetical protein
MLLRIIMATVIVGSGLTTTLHAGVSRALGEKSATDYSIRCRGLTTAQPDYPQRGRQVVLEPLSAMAPT